MKKIGLFSLAFALAGCFLGTGFISGQEQWQYFGVFGLKGFVGVVLTMLLVFVFASTIMLYANRTGECEFDVLLINRPIGWLRALVGAVTVFFMFTTYVVMTAGAGNLLEQTFGIPSVIGRAVICAIIMTVSFLGIAGMFNVLSVFIPILIAFTFIMFFVSAPSVSVEQIASHAVPSENPLLSSWWISSLNNATYNVGASLGVIVTIGVNAKNRKSVLFGATLCVSALLLFSLFLLIMMHSNADCTQAQLPMVAYAASLAPWVEKLFSVFLFVGMFSASLAISVAVCYYLRSKVKRMPKSVGVFGLPTALAAIAFACGSVGFSKLVSIVYPVSGYVSIIFIMMMLINYIKFKYKNSKGEKA